MVSALYRTGELSLPVAFECVEKTEWTDPDEEGRFTRHARETKDEQLRRMVKTAVQTNRLPFGFVVADTWFGSKENMILIPTRTPATQSNHLFCCLHAFVKLERIQAAATLNHFAIKARIYHARLKRCSATCEPYRARRSTA